MKNLILISFYLNILFISKNAYSLSPKIKIEKYKLAPIYRYDLQNDGIWDFTTYISKNELEISIPNSIPNKDNQTKLIKKKFYKNTVEYWELLKISEYEVIPLKFYQEKKISSFVKLRTTEIFKNGNVVKKIKRYLPLQEAWELDDLGLGWVGDLIHGQEEEDISQARYSRDSFSGMCKKVEIFQRAAQNIIGDDLTTEAYDVIDSLWEPTSESEFIHFNNCNDQQIETISRGIWEGLDCLVSNENSTNVEVAANIIGSMQFAKDSLSKKIKFNCKKIEGAYGTASVQCSDSYPTIEIDSSNSEEQMKATAFHEMLHIAGYSHSDSPDKVYGCQASCFSDILNTENLPKNINFSSNSLQRSINAADRMCREDSLSENYEEDFALILLMKNSGLNPLIEDFYLGGFRTNRAEEMAEMVAVKRMMNYGSYQNDGLDTAMMMADADLSSIFFMAMTLPSEHIMFKAAQAYITNRSDFFTQGTPYAITQVIHDRDKLPNRWITEEQLRTLRAAMSDVENPDLFLQKFNTIKQQIDKSKGVDAMKTIGTAYCMKYIERLRNHNLCSPYL